MLAIHTRFLPPTDTKGARLKAVCGDRWSVVIGYPHEAGPGEGAHRVAADALVSRIVREVGPGTPAADSWRAPYVTGALPDGSYAHVYLE